MLLVFLILFLSLNLQSTYSVPTSQAYPASSDSLLLSPKTLISDLNRAVSLESTTEGTLLILEREAHQILVYSPSGEKITIGGYGIEPGALADPVSLTLTPGGRYLLSEKESLRIQLFDSRWISLSQWNLDRSVESNPISSSNRVLPSAAFLLSDGQLLVVDLTNHSLHHFSTNGRHLSSHEFPEEIATLSFRQIDFDGEYLWLLRDQTGELMQLSTRGFYISTLSCGFPAEAFTINSERLLCASSKQLKRLDPSVVSDYVVRVKATDFPVERFLSQPVPEPLTDVLWINDHVYLLTSQSLYHVTWTP